MSVIMKIRQARNPQQVAEELEPLVESLATLAEQAQVSIQSLEEASFRQCREWSENQSKAASQMKLAAAQVAEQVKALEQATTTLQTAAQKIKQAQLGQFWKLVTAASVAGILAGLLATASMLWRAPTPQVQNRLDPQAVAEYLKPAILDALKRR